MIPDKYKRALRDGSPGARRFYVGARRLAGFVRDHRRRAIARSLPVAAPIPQEAGFLVMPAGSLGGVDAVIAEAHAALAAYDHDNPPGGRSKKRFLVNVLAKDHVTPQSAILRFALRPDVLAIVSDYFGMAPILTSVGVYHSDTVDGVPSSSQLYHCDADDTTQVKVFVYCTDVDEQCGPLTLVDAVTTAAVQGRTGYHYGQRLSDEQVRANTATLTEHAILGAAGTVAFVDTSRCFHYGSRVAPGAAARLAVILQYSTPYSFMLPEPYPQALPFRHLSDPAMTDVQRLVLGE